MEETSLLKLYSWHSLPRWCQVANACSSGLGGLVLNVNYSRGGDARLLRMKQFFFLLQVNEQMMRDC